MTKAELLGKFGKQDTVIRVEAWDTDVTINQLSISQGIQVQAELFKGQSIADMGNGKVNVSIDAVSKSTILAVSLALVEPKLSVKELSDMGQDGLAGINEIKEKLDNWDKPKK